MGTILPSIFLSGYVFPLDSMPAASSAWRSSFPTTWLIDAARGVILRGGGWPELWLHAVGAVGHGPAGPDRRLAATPQTAVVAEAQVTLRCWARVARGRRAQLQSNADLQDRSGGHAMLRAAMLRAVMLRAVTSRCCFPLRCRWPLRRRRRTKRNSAARMPSAWRPGSRFRGTMRPITAWPPRTSPTPRSSCCPARSSGIASRSAATTSARFTCGLTRPACPRRWAPCLPILRADPASGGWRMSSIRWPARRSSASGAMAKPGRPPKREWSGRKCPRRLPRARPPMPGCGRCGKSAAGWRPIRPTPATAAGNCV